MILGYVGESDVRHCVVKQILNSPEFLKLCSYREGFGIIRRTNIIRARKLDEDAEIKRKRFLAKAIQKQLKSAKGRRCERYTDCIHERRVHIWRSELAKM